MIDLSKVPTRRQQSRADVVRSIIADCGAQPFTPTQLTLLAQEHPACDDADYDTLHAAVRREVKRLADDGLLTKVSRGVYRNA